ECVGYDGPRLVIELASDGDSQAGVLADVRLVRIRIADGQAVASAEWLRPRRSLGEDPGRCVPIEYVDAGCGLAASDGHADQRVVLAVGSKAAGHGGRVRAGEAVAAPLDVGETDVRSGFEGADRIRDQRPSGKPRRGPHPTQPG